jgi:hypothetical protein
MAENDRRTTIDGDQITDHTISPEEFKTVDDIKTPKRWQVLLYDAIAGKMKWFYTFGNKVMK